MPYCPRCKKNHAQVGAPLVNLRPGIVNTVQPTEQPSVSKSKWKVAVLPLWTTVTEDLPHDGRIGTWTVASIALRDAGLLRNQEKLGPLDVAWAQVGKEDIVLIVRRHPTDKFGVAIASMYGFVHRGDLIDLQYVPQPGYVR